MCYKWVESVFRHMYSTVSQKKNEGFRHSNGPECHHLLLLQWESMRFNVHFLPVYSNGFGSCETFAV